MYMGTWELGIRPSITPDPDEILLPDEWFGLSLLFINKINYF